METEKRFEKIIDRITDAFFIIDADGIMTYASASVSKVVGYSSTELIGKSSLDFIHPDEHEMAVEKQGQLLSYPGSRLTHDYRILNSNHVYQWMECIFVNMTNIPQVGGIMVQMRDVSERKTIELMLEESKEQFRLFMGQIPAAVWIRDEEEKYVFINETFERIRNLKAEDVIGKSFREVFPDDAEQIESTDRLCRDFGKEIVFLDRVHDAYEEEKDWMIYKFPIPRLNGKTYIGALGMDVSKMVKAKEVLQAAEDKFKLVFDHAPDPIFIEDEHMNILDANQKACELQGIPLHELIGMNVLDLTPVTNREQVAEQHKKLWNGASQSLSSFTFSAQGEEIPVEIHSGKITHQGKEALILTLRKESNKVLKLDEV